MNNNKHSFPEQPMISLNGHHGTKNGIVVPNLSALQTAQNNGRSGHPAPVQPKASPNGGAPQPKTATPDLTTRKEAQPHAHKVAKLGKAGENDPLPPSFDDEGQPKTRRIVFQSPTPPSARPVKDTARKQGIEEIAKEFPGRAAELEAELDDGVQAARDRHLDDERAAWERLENENAEVERRNMALETRRAELETERDEAIQPDKERLLKLQEPLAQACGHAGAAVTRAHGVFDPENVDALVIRNSMAMPLAALAGRLALPLVPEDRDWGENVARWTDIGSGMLFGTSLGLLAGFFEVSALQTLQPGPLAMWLISMGLGSVVTVEASHSLVGSAARLSELRWVGQDAKGCAPALLRLTGETAALLTIWTMVDGHGIMKSVSLHAANNGGGGGGAMMTLAAGAAAAVPFVAFALTRGSRQGRLRGVTLKLQGAQEDELRARSEVAEAMAAVSQVTEIERQQWVVSERIAQMCQPFEVELSRLAALVREPRFDLHESEKQKLRKTHDEWFEAFGDWKAEWRRLIDLVEPLRGKPRSKPNGERVTRQGGSRLGLWERLKDWWQQRRR